MQSQESLKGIYYGVAAFVMWGLVPVYFKAVSHISPLEVIAHRVVWSCLFLALLITYTRHWEDIRQHISCKKTLLALLLSAIVIAINWLVFIWAVSQSRIVETTLGYFINPLINIVFGMAFLGERLRPLQWCAVLLALIGVAYQLFLLGELPWIALVLACSFSVYSLLRKQVPVDSSSGLFIETLWLLPLAMAYLFWLNTQTGLQLFTSMDNALLLLAAGLVTSLPLLAFAAGARRLTLTTIGLIQYIGPSIAFAIAVFYYQEPMDANRLITFLFIWAGLVVFSADGIIRNRSSANIPP